MTNQLTQLNSELDGIHPWIHTIKIQKITIMRLNLCFNDNESFVRFYNGNSNFMK